MGCDILSNFFVPGGENCQPPLSLFLRKKLPVFAIIVYNLLRLSWAPFAIIYGFEPMPTRAAAPNGSDPHIGDTELLMVITFCSGDHL